MQLRGKSVVLVSLTKASSMCVNAEQRLRKRKKEFESKTITESLVMVGLF